MKKLIVWMSVCVVWGSYARDRLSVTNNTPQEVYGAFYYSINGPVMKRASCVYAISTHQERVIPMQKYLPNVFTRFVVAPKKNDLKEYVYTALSPTVYSRYFDPFTDMSYVITKRNGLFFIYNQEEWKQVRTILKIKEPKKVGLLRNKIKRDFVAFRDNPYKYTVAHVRKGNELSVGEKKAVKNRIKRVKKALENKFNKQVSYTPKIALATSGGGYRAMIMSIGFLVAAEEIGLKDMITWWATCSGSGWATAPYYAMKLHYENNFKQEMSAFDFRDTFFNLIKDQTISKIFLPGITGEKRLMHNARLVSWASGPTTLVNYFGTALGGQLFSFFGDDRHRQYLSRVAPLVQEGGDMIPLWSVVDEKTEKIWYEFSPWEFGSASDELYVPMWGLGREFIGGNSVNFSPEKSFDFIVGATGSAIGARFSQMYTQSLEKSGSREGKLGKIILRGKLGLERVTFTKLYNYAFQFAGTEKENKYRKLVDAGLVGNLPYPVVSGERIERNPDMIIFLDLGEWVENKPEYFKLHGLRYAELYAKSHNLKFPVIDYTKVGKEPISIFEDEQDSGVPIVLYIPWQTNAQGWSVIEKDARYQKYRSLINFDLEDHIHGGFADTVNFKYSFDQAMQLSYVSEFHLLMVQDEIFKAIERLINRKG